MSDKSDDTTKKEELVITPGGPRPKDRVHAVGPGEVVTVDESGNMIVIPSEQEGGTVNMAQDMVLTPGGFRPKSLVHFIEPGHVLVEIGHVIVSVCAANVVVDVMEYYAHGESVRGLVD